jgi:hypothetical protein
MVYKEEFLKDDRKRDMARRGLSDFLMRSSFF